LLALAHTRTGRHLFRERAEETVDWLAREMTTEGGAFCASLDADSEGEEGKFYVWSLAEIEEILGPDDAGYIAECYDVTVEGNFEGHNILNRLNHISGTPNPPETPPSSNSMLQDRRSITNGSEAPNSGAQTTLNTDSMLRNDRSIGRDDRITALRHRLLQARGKRIRPGLDDKVLADWNGLMIAALANAAVTLHQPNWLQMAKRAFSFIERHMTQGDRLGHSWRDGKLLLPGLASDHAAMIRAAIALFEATGTPEYLGRAFQWQKALDRHYVHQVTGGYYLTADDAEGLVVRPDSTIDEATPNPNGIAAQNLVRLAILTGDDIWRERADILFDGLLPTAAESMYLHASLINALDLRLRAIQIVAIGPRADAFADVALGLPFLDRVVMRTARTEDLPPAHLARTVSLADGQSAALVCAGEKCSLPVKDPGQLIAAVAAARGATAAL
jgi:uncharacterized protein YyaL (SSP411 family)